MPPTATLAQEAGTNNITPTQPAPIFTFVKRSQVIRAIRDEAVAAGVPCSRKLAGKVFDMVEEAVIFIRQERYEVKYHLTGDDLKLHDVFEVVIRPHKAKVPEGSAHALLHRALLESNELTLVHTRDERLGVVWCAVALELNRQS